MSVLTDTQLGLPTGVWSLDKIHSTIGFEIPYLAGTFRGQFTDVDARVDEKGLTGSARVASIDVKDENLSIHLQSPDFFDAERNPELKFESREIDRSGEQITISGDIRIRGVTKPVELTGTISEPLTDYADRERFGLKLETAVDRTEFGVNWNAPLPSGEPALQNEVKLVAELYFIKEA
jgi:polyisoprenoid-binding protein YceI